MAKIPDADRNHQIIEALAGLGKEDFRAAASEMAFRYGVSVKRIYDLTKPLRHKRKANKGKAFYGTQILEQLAARALQKNYSAIDAIQEAIMAGDLERHAAPSARTLNRFLETYGMNCTRRKRWLSRHEKNGVKRIKETGGHHIEARAANFAWQSDTTRAPSFWIKDLDGSIRYESPTTTASKNHSGKTAREDRFPVHLYSIVDDKSRLRFAWCFAGVNQHNTMSFIHKAMSEKTTDLFLDTPGKPDYWPAPEDPKWKELSSDPEYTKKVVRNLDWINPARLPLRGIPNVLFTDQGPEYKNALVQSALNRLGIRLIMHAPEHSNATGKIENTFKVYLPFFESIRGKNYTLYQMNVLLLDYLIKLNSRTHTSTGQVPVFAWLGDEEKVLRELADPHLFKLLMYRPQTVTVNYFYEFSIDGTIFKLPADRAPFDRMCKRKVSVYVNHIELARAKKGIADFPEFFVEWNEEIYWFAAVPASTVEPVRLGEEFRPVSESFTEAKYKELMRRELKDPDVPGYYNELYAPNVLYPPKAADEEIKIDFPFAAAARPINIYAAMEMLQKDQIFADPIEEYEKEFIEEFFGAREEVPETEIRALISDIKKGHISIGGDNAAQSKAAI